MKKNAAANPPPQPAAPCATGIGWGLSRLFPARSASAEEAATADAFYPAAARQSRTEVAAATALAGAWSFLAIGAWLLDRDGLSTAAVAARMLVWPLAWLLLLHALALLPSAVLLPLARLARVESSRVEKWLQPAAHAILLLLALRLTAASALPGRVLGWLWIALILVDAALRLLRRVLRLAKRPG